MKNKSRDSVWDFLNRNENILNQKNKITFGLKSVRVVDEWIVLDLRHAWMNEWITFPQINLNSGLISLRLKRAKRKVSYREKTETSSVLRKSNRTEASLLSLLLFNMKSLPLSPSLSFLCLGGGGGGEVGGSPASLPSSDQCPGHSLSDVARREMLWILATWPRALIAKIDSSSAASLLLLLLRAREGREIKSR